MNPKQRRKNERKLEKLKQDKAKASDEVRKQFIKNLDAAKEKRKSK